MKWYFDSVRPTLLDHRHWRQPPQYCRFMIWIRERSKQSRRLKGLWTDNWLIYRYPLELLTRSFLIAVYWVESIVRPISLTFTYVFNCNFQRRSINRTTYVKAEGNQYAVHVDRITRSSIQLNFNILYLSLHSPIAPLKANITLFHCLHEF